VKFWLEAVIYLARTADRLPLNRLFPIPPKPP
jgi:hypothetical protein